MFSFLDQTTAPTAQPEPAARPASRPLRVVAPPSAPTTSSAAQEDDSTPVVSVVACPKRSWRELIGDTSSRANVTDTRFLGAERAAQPHPRTPRFNYVYLPDWTLENVMRLIVNDGETALLLEGPHGGGKSDLPAFLAMMLGKPLETITFDGQVDMADVLGRWVLRKGEQIWQDGKIVRAMKTGAWLRVDEINAAPAECNIIFNDIADGKPYYVRESDELVHPAPGFRLIGTMNPHVEYRLNQFNIATLDRFVRVGIAYPERPLERERLRANFPTIADRDLDVLLDIAERTRQQKANDPTREFIIGPRMLVKTCRMIERSGFPLATAIDLGIIQKAAYFGEEIADALRAEVSSIIATRSTTKP